MPTYDYKCQACQHVFELFHGISEEPMPDCPKCGEPCERVISGGAGLIFKGGGFHGTNRRARPESASCDRSTPCCGLSEPCNTPPCSR